MHWDCPVFKYLGFYCPGCGGTRSVLALLKGDILTSFRYHPLVLYLVIVAALFAVTFLLSVITKGRIKRVRFSLVYVWIGLGIIVVNWIVKNIFLFAGNPLI